MLRHSPEPEHGDVTLCIKCGKAIQCFVREEPIGGGEYERVEMWWSHFNHPSDHHDAEVNAWPTK